MKILIAEDENKTRERIAKNISLLSFVDCIFQAKDGQEAIELLKQHTSSIDVFITDICMPNLTGLDVIKFIRENEMDIEIIIMSGYNDFEYARTALRNNVLDYILKPVDPSGLRNLLQSIYERIQQKKYKESNSRTHFFNKVLQGTDSTTRTLLQEMEVLRLPVESNLYILGFPVSSDKEKIDSSLIPTINEYKKILIDNTTTFYCFSCSNYGPAIIFIFNNQTEEYAKKKAADISKKIIEMLEENQPLHMTMVLTSPEKNLHTLPSAKEKGILRVNVELDFKNKIITCDSNGAGDKENTSSEAEIDGMIKNIETLILYSRDDIKANVDHIFETLSKLYCKNPILAKEKEAEIKIRLSSLVRLNTNNASPSEILNSNLEKLQETERLHIMRDNASSILCYLKSMKEKENIPLSQRISDTVKKNVENNLSNEQFSVTDATKGLNYSENYIRYIFTNHEGLSIKEYITKRRMEKAKEYLQKGIQIKQVAELVGYNNQRYFASSFKDYTGYTPTEWRDDSTRKNK